MNFETIKNIEIEILNPIHPGFYYTIISDPDDHLFEGDDDELGGFLSKNDVSIEYDFKEYMAAVTDNIDDLMIEVINDEIYYQFDIQGMIIKKVDSELISPKYYNYETDRSYVTVQVCAPLYYKFIDHMFNDLWDALDDQIKKNHTSYDGFISFYSNDIRDWYDKRYNLDYNELKTLFQVLIKQHAYYTEYDIMDALLEYSTECFLNSNWYYEMIDGSKFDYWILHDLIVDQNIPTIPGGM